MLDVPAWVGLSVLGVVGAVAAIINTMAGGGSLLILPVLVALGIPTSVANGTIRVGVLAQSAASVWTFHRQGIRELRLVATLAPATVAGAAAGTWAATRVPDEVLRPLFGVVLTGWAFFLLVKPGAFTRPGAERRPITAVTHVLALVVGAYGGMLQAGVGFPLLALLVVHLGADAVRANAAKLGLTLAYTCVSLPIFAQAGQVAWVEGAVLAAGSMLGAWIGSRWQVRAGANLVRWFLVVTVTISGILMVAPALAGS